LHPIVLATSRIVLALVFSFSFPFYKQVLLYLLLLSPKGFCALKHLLSLVVVPVVAVSKNLLLSLSLSDKQSSNGCVSKYCFLFVFLSFAEVIFESFS
jgi:hypothetical protein